MTYRNREKFSAPCAAFVGLWLLASPQLYAGQTGVRNAGALKGQMKILEAVINEGLARTFAPPFGVLEKAKGSYLPDFGVVFSLEVDLYPVRVPSPFDLRPTSKEELAKARKSKLERIGTIKQTVPQLLADHASELRDLSPDDSIAVVVHLFDVPLEADDLPSQVVIEVKKRDLDQFWDKKLSQDALRGKMRTLEL